MSRPGDEARQRARDIRDEALARHAERDRADIALLRAEIAELKSMLREQQAGLAALTGMVAALNDRPPQAQPGAPSDSSSPRPLTDRKRQALERIRDLRARHLSFSAICDIFRAEGVPHPVRRGRVVQGHALEPMEEPSPPARRRHRVTPRVVPVASLSGRSRREPW